MTYNRIYSICFILLVVLGSYTQIKKKINFVYFRNKTSLSIRLTIFQPIKNKQKNLINKFYIETIKRHLF